MTETARTLAQAVQFYRLASLAANTRRAYESDLRMMEVQGISALSTTTDIAAYIAREAEYLSPFTLTRRLSALSYACRSAGLPDHAGAPLTQQVLRGVWRVRGKRQRPASGLRLDDLRVMVIASKGRTGVRDRALLLTGFRGAMRRSELVSIECADVSFCDGGMSIFVRRSKTDPFGNGRALLIPRSDDSTCAVTALEAWLEEAELKDGRIFRSISRSGRIGNPLSPQSVSLIVKARARAVGIPASYLSAHSLRRGFITESIRSGAGIDAVKQQSGHRCVETLFRYVDTNHDFSRNANVVLR